MDKSGSWRSHKILKTKYKYSQFKKSQNKNIVLDIIIVENNA